MEESMSDDCFSSHISRDSVGSVAKISLSQRRA
jgi:hypothetical protein